MFKRGLQPFALAAGLLFCSVFAAAQDTAHDVVRKATDDILEVLKQAPSYVDKDPDRYYDAVHQVLDPVIDYRGFARGVMGDYASTPRYRSLDEAGQAELRDQLERFTETIRIGLIRTYGKGLLAFGGSRFELASPDDSQAGGRVVSVEQLIYNDQAKPYVVKYQMGQDRSAEWKLRNVIIEDINLGQIYRQQFEAAARKYKGDLNAVITNWSSEEADAS